MKAHTFSALVRWTGAASGGTRDYATYSREYLVEIDGKDQLRGSADAAFRGDSALHNPEDLLVASLSACHLLSYLALCARRGVEVISYEDRAVGTMEHRDGKIRFTDVVLRPVCVVRGDAEAALRLHEQAHSECFIANSVNFPVRHEARVDSEQHAF